MKVTRLDKSDLADLIHASYHGIPAMLEILTMKKVSYSCDLCGHIYDTPQINLKIWKNNETIIEMDLCESCQERLTEIFNNHPKPRL